MNARSSLILAAGASLLLVGCGDSKDPSTTLEPQTQSLVGVSGAPSCTNQVVNAISSATKTLFGANSPQATLAGQIDRTNQQGNVTPGFQLLRAVATLRDGPNWAASQAGTAATLTVNLIWCMDVAITAPVADITVANFTAALGAQGLYAIRGGASDVNDAAIAHDGRSGIGPILPATFASHLGGQALIYGREITIDGLAANAGRRYDFSLVRSNKAALTGLTARSLCAEFAVGNRIEHQSGTQHTILPEVAPVLSCPPDPVASVSGGLFERIKSFVLPTPAYARRLTGSKNGGTGGYSPHWLVNPGAVTLTFTIQPKNGNINSPIPVAVKAVGNNADPSKPGVPWEGVDIRIDAFNNNGSWVCSSGNVAQTDANGVASFPNFTLNKPGGYALTAVTATSTDGDGTQNGNYTNSVTSNRFNLQQKGTSSDPGTCPP